MATPAEVLRRICSADPTRTNINEPFGVEYEGRRWVVGTDGHCMVMVPGEHPSREKAPDVAKVFEPEPPPLTHRVSVAALKEWTGPAPRPPSWTTCEKCDGDGELECPTCGSDEYECPECGGDGKHGVPMGMQCGALLAGCLNKVLLAHVLSTLPPDVKEIRIGQRAEMEIYFLRAPDWIGVVMPIRYGQVTSRFEALEAEP